jgi:hypothetical protein
MALEGFRLRALDRGLSKVETEEPDTKEGVRIVAGGDSMLLRFGTDDGTVVADISYAEDAEPFGADVGPGGLRKPFF